MNNQTRDQIIRGTPLPESCIVYQFQWRDMLLPNIWNDITNQELLAAVKEKPESYTLRAVVPVDVLLRAPATTVASVRADLAEAGCAQRENKFESEAPAAGQAGLAKLQRYDVVAWGSNNICPVDDGDYYAVADVEALVATLAAPVAADTEQATKRIPPPNDAMLRWALRELLSTLPERRDWFNPDAEEVLRDVLKSLATPADAVAGLTEQQIIAAWNDTEAGGMVGRYIRFARAIEVLARMPTSGAPVTASVILMARSPEGDPWQEVSAEDFFKARRNGYEVSVCVNKDNENSIRLEAPAPVTAEPVAGIDWPAIKATLTNVIAVASVRVPNKDADDEALLDAADSAVATLDRHIATPAPADRDAILDECVKIAKSELRNTSVLYSNPLQSSAAWNIANRLGALKSMERAADAAETRDAEGGE